MSRPMKDSGVEWLGNIPTDWTIIKLKYVFSIIGGNGFPDMLQGNTEGDYPFCKVSDINGEGDYVETASNWVSQSVVDSKRFNIIPTGSIIMAKIGAALAKNHRKINKVKCCIDNNTQALVPIRADDIRFLFYLSKCVDMSWFDNNSTVPSINNPKLLNFFVPFPPLEEQQRIATFLDGKCALIDSVMEKTRASIEEYKKLKQSVITRAVTKGIRPARTMKDSGVEWIGDIPADWSTCRLRFLCDILTGNQDTQDNDPNGEYPFYVRSPIVERSNKYTFEGDAILMAGDGAGAGKVFHYVSGKYGCHQRVYSLQNIKGIVRRFLFYYLQNRFYVSIETANSKSTVDSVRLNMLKDFPILMPPLEEQEEIASYLDEKCKAIDGLTAKKEKLLSELASYKKSLIFEYVTGKKAVAQC